MLTLVQRHCLTTYCQKEQRRGWTGKLTHILSYRLCVSYLSLCYQQGREEVDMNVLTFACTNMLVMFVMIQQVQWQDILFGNAMWCAAQYDIDMYYKQLNSTCW